MKDLDTIVNEGFFSKARNKLSRIKESMSRLPNYALAAASLVTLFNTVTPARAAPENPSNTLDGTVYASWTYETNSNASFNGNAELYIFNIGKTRPRSF